MQRCFQGLGLLGLILAAGCQPAAEEEIDYDQIVQQDQEWTSSPADGDKAIAGDLFPDPQEFLIDDSSL